MNNVMKHKKVHLVIRSSDRPLLAILSFVHQGSLMDDCMAVTLCYQCALCQLMREHKSLKYQVEAPVPQTMEYGRENMGYDQ